VLLLLLLAVRRLTGTGTVDDACVACTANGACASGFYFDSTRCVVLWEYSAATAPGNRTGEWLDGHASK
jgi:nicotinamidase-related amidase